MSNIETKENKIVEKIGQTLTKLDASLGKMESTDSRLKGWYEQEKAIHEVKKAVRESEHYDDVAGTWDDYEYDEASDEKHMGKALVKIDRRLNMLEETLDKLEDSDTGRLKGWYEQRKAIHDIKKILHQVDKYDMYDEDEMSLYA